ncbi:MAG: HAD family hydrolase [Acidimicrobiia bacterium]
MQFRVLYSDVDGTITGPRGELLAGADNTPTLAAVEALIAARAAGLTIVLCSGRDRLRLAETARLLGLRDYLAELGGVCVTAEGEVPTYARGACPGDGPPAQTILPIAQAIVAQNPGRAELHDPWNANREISIMVRGTLDLDATHAWLRDQGYDWVRVHENGVSARTSPTLPDVAPMHVYHVTPDGIAKASAIATDIARRGVDPSECAFVGDAAADLDVAPYVGRMYLVGNGLAHRPHLASTLDQHPNASVTRAHYGDGFAECVHALLDA